MLSEITEAIAEIIYDHDMENQGYKEWVKWEVLEPSVQEDFLKVAESVIEVINDEGYLLTEDDE
jgi:DNA-directed RNA polymerase specialized sigma54-like protein